MSQAYCCLTPYTHMGRHAWYAYCSLPPTYGAVAGGPPEWLTPTVYSISSTGGYFVVGRVCRVGCLNGVTFVISWLLPNITPLLSIYALSSSHSLSTYTLSVCHLQDLTSDPKQCILVLVRKFNTYRKGDTRNGTSGSTQEKFLWETTGGVCRHDGRRLRVSDSRGHYVVNHIRRCIFVREDILELLILMGVSLIGVLVLYAIRQLNQ